MKEVEHTFLKAAELGDYYAIQTILHKYPDFDVDCVDALGRTPLRLAVKNQHVEVGILTLCYPVVQVEGYNIICFSHMPNVDFL